MKIALTLVALVVSSSLSFSQEMRPSVQDAWRNNWLPSFGAPAPYVKRLPFFFNPPLSVSVQRECTAGFYDEEFCWQDYTPPTGTSICDFSISVISSHHGDYIYFYSPKDLKVRLHAKGSLNILNRWRGWENVKITISTIPSSLPRPRHCFINAWYGYGGGQGQYPPRG